MSRILCLVHPGASYQCSADRMSGRPSLLKSATATLSLKPGSIICTLKAMSAGRLRTGVAGGAAWLAALDDCRHWRLGGPPSPAGFGETSRRSAVGSTARDGG